VIAVDTSTLIAFIQGARDEDVERFDASLAANEVVLPPAVLTEFLSEPKLPVGHRTMALGLPVLDLQPDYWLRTATARAVLLGKGLRARLADALIAQSCIDHDVVLITRDRDFRQFQKHCGLKLA
jgi:predicted nucleic acid-binding protein